MSELPPFARTTCDCKHCTVGCKTMPGCLIPGDVERILEYVKPADPWEWLVSHFLASSGAIVAERTPQGIVQFSVPTLVPAQREDGSCVFLDADAHCTIHPVSPFGCAYHDTHLDAEEADRRSRYAVIAQMGEHPDRDAVTYRVFWAGLQEQGRVTAATAVRRKAFTEMFERLT